MLPSFVDEPLSFIRIRILVDCYLVLTRLDSLLVHVSSMFKQIIERELTELFDLATLVNNLFGDLPLQVIERSLVLPKLLVLRGASFLRNQLLFIDKRVLVLLGMLRRSNLLFLIQVQVLHITTVDRARTLFLLFSFRASHRWRKTESVA